jgi:hypothetical protein
MRKYRKPVPRQIALLLAITGSMCTSAGFADNGNSSAQKTVETKDSRFLKGRLIKGHKLDVAGAKESQDWSDEDFEKAPTGVIGIQVVASDQHSSLEQDAPVITWVFPNLPADGKLMGQDRIIQVGDQKFTARSKAADVVRAVCGKPGTTVSIKVRRGFYKEPHIVEYKLVRMSVDAIEHDGIRHSYAAPDEAPPETGDVTGSLPQK